MHAFGIVILLNLVSFQNSGAMKQSKVAWTTTLYWLTLNQMQVYIKQYKISKEHDLSKFPS